MIHVDDDKILVSGPGLDVMAQCGKVISSLAESLKRQGADEKYVRSFFHRLVDISLAAPSSGTTIDLSFKKEG